MTTLPQQPTLLELQTWVAARIVDPRLIDCSADEGPLFPPAAGDVAVRLHAYADGYPARIREVLVDTFPALTHLIGERRTTELTHRYLAACRPRSFNLNLAGHGLPGYLRSDPLSADLPFLPDLALLEWRLAVAFHAQQLDPLDPMRLASWAPADWETAVLRFQPAVAVISSPWPLRALRAARETPPEKIDINMSLGPEHLLLYRQGFTVRCDPIGAAEAGTLGSLLSGASLGGVTGKLAEAGQDPSRAGEWFRRWMQLGLIAGCARKECAS
jgi:hypothetical protein